MDSAKHCQNIHSYATANLAALEPYGVPAALLADLSIKIEAYVASLPTPRVSIVSGKSATRKLAAEFRAADEVLTEGLDKLAPQFKATQPAFVEDYFNARIIIDSASSAHSSPANTVSVAIPQAQPKAA